MKVLSSAAEGVSKEMSPLKSKVARNNGREGVPKGTSTPKAVRKNGHEGVLKEMGTPQSAHSNGHEAFFSPSSPTTDTSRGRSRGRRTMPDRSSSNSRACSDIIFMTEPVNDVFWRLEKLAMPRWPLVSPKHTPKKNGGSKSPGGFAVPPLRLDDPLDCLAKLDLDPNELSAYRRDYQAFRLGGGRGAIGQIEDLGLTESESPQDTLAAGTRFECGSNSAGEEDAYYSEPERGTTHSPAGNLAGTGRAIAANLQEFRVSSKNQLGFLAWLTDEVQSRPEEAQLERVPPSHLKELLACPIRLEKVLGFGFVLCLDILLHELSFTPLQVVLALARFLLKRRPLSLTESCDVLRLFLLLLNVAFIYKYFDVSQVYHYIRGESFLKLYVIFNMLEMFERWIRSIGVDLFDLLMASVRHPWRSLLPKVLVTLLYCFIHSFMHFLRVLLLNVAINTSENAVFLIIVTNNFGEIKSTVFKRYEAKSLFPIITSDIVERFYLVLDIIFVLMRLSISPHAGTYTVSEIGYWLLLIVILEIVTDWIKFMLILKFSSLEASTLENYKYVLISDILLCRTHSRNPLGLNAEENQNRSRLAMPFRGIHSFSHVPARRIGFSGVPLSTLVVVHLVMLSQSPCSLTVTLMPRFASLFLGGICLLALLFLFKVFVGLLLFGLAARRRQEAFKAVSEQELFSKIKAL